jgi:hypothetical protein
MSDVVRAVLLERYVYVPPGVERKRAVLVYGRAGWSASLRRAEFKGWIDTIRESSKTVAPELKTRSRSRKECRDPMMAQEWAWAMWDRYRDDIRRAIRAIASSGA